MADLHQPLQAAFHRLLEISFYRKQSYIMNQWLEDSVQLIRMVLSNNRFELSSYKLPQTKNTVDGIGDIILKEMNDFTALRQKFINQVHRLLRLDIRPCTSESLIHCVCEVILSQSREISVSIYPVKFILQLGADPNHVDNNGETVVGCVLKHPQQRQEMMYGLLKALMEGGAHLDGYKRSSVGNTPDGNLRHFFKQYHICPVRNKKMACLVASAMRCNGYLSQNPSAKEFLPNCLLTFLDLH